MGSLFSVSVWTGLLYEHIRMTSKRKYCWSSLVEIGSVVLEKEMKMRKRTTKKKDQILTITYSGLQLRGDKIKSHIDMH